MAYSRWGTSKWYTFWSMVFRRVNDVRRKDQVFEICNVCKFTYKELTENIENCLKKAEIEENRLSIFTSRSVTEDEISELKKYMLKFINDVNSDKNLTDD